MLVILPSASRALSASLYCEISAEHSRVYCNKNNKHQQQHDDDKRDNVRNNSTIIQCHHHHKQVGTPRKFEDNHVPRIGAGMRRMRGT